MDSKGDFSFHRENYVLRVQPPDDFTIVKGVCKTEANKTLHVITPHFVIGAHHPAKTIPEQGSLMDVPFGGCFRETGHKY